MPESFEKLTNLKSLDLFNNLLMEIPKCFTQLTKLVRLDIEEVYLNTNVGVFVFTTGGKSYIAPKINRVPTGKTTLLNYCIVNVFNMLFNES